MSGPPTIPWHLFPDDDKDRPCFFGPAPGSSKIAVPIVVVLPGYMYIPSASLGRRIAPPTLSVPTQRVLLVQQSRLDDYSQQKKNASVAIRMAPFDHGPLTSRVVPDPSVEPTWLHARRSFGSVRLPESSSARPACPKPALQYFTHNNVHTVQYSATSVSVLAGPACLGSLARTIPKRMGSATIIRLDHLSWNHQISRNPLARSASTTARISVSPLHPTSVYDQFLPTGFDSRCWTKKTGHVPRPRRSRSPSTTVRRASRRHGKSSPSRAQLELARRVSERGRTTRPSFDVTLARTRRPTLREVAAVQDPRPCL